MNLFETLQQFKNISPDPAYKEKSKRAILATIPKQPLNAWRIIARVFETGIAVGLAVFFILVITGQFSNVPYVSPVHFSVINPETLRAEAQAVDIQIQLADVAYQETTSTPVAITNETTPPEIASTSFTPAALQATGVSSSSIIAAATSTSTSTPVSVDQALQQLSQ